MDRKTEINTALGQGRLQDAAALIKQAMREGADLSGQNIAYSNMLVLSAPWRDAAALAPADTNFFFTSGWLNSLAKGRPVNAQGQPVPWITYPALEFIETLLQPSWMVFEWGSGNSTLWWSARVKSVHAVEDNVQWQQEVSKQMPANAVVVPAPTREEYVGALAAAPETPYDVVVIDGSYRNDCAHAAIAGLSDRGIIIFDNTDSQIHAEGIAHLDSLGFLRLDFWGLIPSYTYKNCTSVFVRDPAMLRNLPPPSAHRSSVGPSCQQAMDAAARQAGQ